MSDVKRDVISINQNSKQYFPLRAEPTRHVTVERPKEERKLFFNQPLLPTTKSAH
jgi:hypothetical protein